MSGASTQGAQSTRLTPMEHAALDGLRAVPAWAQQRAVIGVGPAMVNACQRETWMTVEQTRRALNGCVRKGAALRPGRGAFALPDWPAALEGGSDA